jgi:hypothetical protein
VARRYHTDALAAGGTAYCWGANRSRDRGVAARLGRPDGVCRESGSVASYGMRRRGGFAKPSDAPGRAARERVSTALARVQVGPYVVPRAAEAPTSNSRLNRWT